MVSMIGTKRKISTWIQPEYQSKDSRTHSLECCEWIRAIFQFMLQKYTAWQPKFSNRRHSIVKWRAEILDRRRHSFVKLALRPNKITTKSMVVVAIKRSYIWLQNCLKWTTFSENQPPVCIAKKFQKIVSNHHRQLLQFNRNNDDYIQFGAVRC